MYIHVPGTETKHVINGVWVIDETIWHPQEREADLSIRLHHPQQTCRDTHSLHLKLKQNVNNNNNNNNMYMSKLLRLIFMQLLVQTVNLAGRRGLIRTRPQSLTQGRGSMSDGGCGRSVWTGRGETGTQMDGYCMMDALKKEREGRRERGGEREGGGERGEEREGGGERGGRRERGEERERGGERELLKTLTRVTREERMLTANLLTQRMMKRTQRQVRSMILVSDWNLVTTAAITGHV